MGEHKRPKPKPATGGLGIIMKDGKPTMVMRPRDPEKAIRIAKECAEQNDTERLANLMEEVGWPYLFVGYLSQSGSVVDEKGNVVDTMQPGDSLMTLGDKPS